MYQSPLTYITLATLLGLSSQTDSSSSEIEYILLPNGENTCKRPCEEGAHQVCHYKFKLEWYYTMSKACYDCPYNKTDCSRPHCVAADGIKRPIVTVNRQMPGPAIEVCKGDLVIVDVTNGLISDGTTIHWHGFHQRGTPYMDGVPFVTQCPIEPGSTFRYQFKAENAGTHFWHSHSGFQRADGAFGSFIVRTPDSKNPHRTRYDHDLSEHIIYLIDWDHDIVIKQFLAHHHSDGDNKPPNLLINGKGRFNFPTKEVDSLNKTVFMPIETFRVEKNQRYRFRIINAEFLNCPVEMTIDNHTLLVISSDGNDVDPVEVTSLVTYAGERFDFILNANQPVDSYLIRFRGLMDCDQRFTKAYQVAILRYHGAKTTDLTDLDEPVDWFNAHNDGLQLNSLNVARNQSMSISAVDLTSVDDDDDDAALKPEADLKYYVSYDFYFKDNPHYNRKSLYGINQVKKRPMMLLTPQLNHISFKAAHFPLLPQRDLITDHTFCNESTVHDCNSTHFCECTHVVNVRLGDVVELILIDEGFTFDANHPFHLHGHSFRVVAMDRVGPNVTMDQVKQLDRLGRIKRKLKGAPKKDTVTVPDGGYTIVRFHATNPGFWLFHCHIEFHVEVGMAFIFKVGEFDEFPTVPRNFPKCGNWMPKSAGDEGTGLVKELERGVASLENEIAALVERTRNLSEFVHFWRDLDQSGGVNGGRTRQWGVVALIIGVLLCTAIR